MVEQMFEGRGDPATFTDEALVGALTVATQGEAAQAAWRLALVAEVTARQCDDEDDEFAHQVIDGWAFAKADVAAACNLGPHAASKQMRIAMALRTRLPRTAEVFASGAVSARVIDAITWRTKLIIDPDAMALVDAAIAGEAAECGTKSEDALIQAVDLWVEKFDPVAVIRSKAAAQDRYVEFDDKDDPNGVSSFWGRLRVTDRKALEQRLNDLADTVCPDDPRTKRELRADALGSLGVVGPTLQRLTCLCGNPECEGSGKDPRAGAVTIYALTDQIPDAHDVAPPQPTRPSPTVPGPGAKPGPAASQPPAEAEPDEPAPAEPKPTEPAASAKPAAASRAGVGVGVLLDGGIIPAPMLAELIASGATVRPLPTAAELGSERQYRPSTKLAAFVRMCSLRCMFPGCGKPAHKCDLDHLTPWPAGATHPGNLDPLCREHHLVKTFCGWTPTARPDGAVEWTAPSGRSYVKKPGVAVLFPDRQIDIPVPRKRAIRLLENDTDRTAKMPRRQRTRAQDREQRINAERTRNVLAIALDPNPNSNDPPPF